MAECTYCGKPDKTHDGCMEEYARRLSAGLCVVCGESEPDDFKQIQHDRCGNVPYSGYSG